MPDPHAAPLRDDYTPGEITAAEVKHHGEMWDVVHETVNLPEASGLQREFLDHNGAVGIAVIDDQQRILLINQYRQPVRGRVWEIPAGLLDEPGEDPWHAAQRELAEEVDLVADSWHVLADILSSPGGMSETLRIYLARDLSEVPLADRHERDGEERGIVRRWVSLPEAVAAAAAGRIGNATALVAILLADKALTDQALLRPATTPWPARRVPARFAEAATAAGIDPSRITQIPAHNPAQDTDPPANASAAER